MIGNTLSNVFKNGIILSIFITFFVYHNSLSKYFNKSLDNVYSSQEIENFRKKLYHYRDLLGTNQDYTFFNDYYIEIQLRN